MQAQETDMTIFFRKLAHLPVTAGGQVDDMLPILSDAFYKPLTEANEGKWKKWLGAYARRLKEEGMGDEQRKEMMNKANPKYVLRNYIAQTAIDAAEAGDFSLVNEVLDCTNSAPKRWRAFTWQECTPVRMLNS